MGGRRERRGPAATEGEWGGLKRTFGGVRRRSTRSIGGLPLWEVAFGPDVSRGELRGHARAVFALGDLATGWLAIGGVAMGGVALGGLALAVVPIGGLAVGGLALGGAAAGLAAAGGAAAGWVAVGGAAFGYYAYGGIAAGEFVLSALRQDPEAAGLFRAWLPGWALPAGAGRPS